MSNSDLQELTARRVLDSIVAASLHREAQLQKHEDELSAICTSFADHYEDFLMWESAVRSCWAQDPNTYDKGIHTEINRIHDMWFESARKVSRILSSDVVEQLSIKDKDRVLSHWQVILSVESADNGPVPQHIVEATERAVQERQQP